MGDFPVDVTPVNPPEPALVGFVSNINEEKAHREELAQNSENYWGWELKAHLVPPRAVGRDIFLYPRLFQTLSKVAWSTSRGGTGHWQITL